jgi:hypothetical protein
MYDKGMLNYPFLFLGERQLIVVGKGESPDAAVADLVSKLEASAHEQSNT